MYSPKIHDDLIPRIYQVAKRAKIPMTRWVNQILERALADQEVSTDTRLRVNASPMEKCCHDNGVPGTTICQCTLEARRTGGDVDSDEVSVEPVPWDWLLSSLYPAMLVV